jgi:hypothetical protein
VVCIICPHQYHVPTNTMSNFSDREDRHLVQLAVVHGDQQQRISWAQVAKKMKYSGKDSRTLRLRLATLKHTHGKILQNSPAWFFKPPTSRSPSSTRPPRRSANQPFEPARTGESPQCLARVPISTSDAYVALQRIFGHVRKKDVRQEAGRVETNVGEITPIGVTKVIELCSLSDADVFLDVGSGIANIVAQVALQTAVTSVIGVEIRHDVAALSQDMLCANASEYPQPLKARVIYSDVRDVEADPSGVMSTTVRKQLTVHATQQSRTSWSLLCAASPSARDSRRQSVPTPQLSLREHVLRNVDFARNDWSPIRVQGGSPRLVQVREDICASLKRSCSSRKMTDEQA